MIKIKKLGSTGLLFFVLQTLSVQAQIIEDCIQHANPERAIAACTELLKDKTQTRPQLAALYQLRGVAHDNNGKFGKAIADYSRAIRLKPDDEVHFNRGEAYFNQQQYRKAIKDFSRAIRFNRNMANAYYTRGTSYFHLRRFRKAIKDFSRTIHLNPQYAPAYRNRAVAYKSRGKNNKAAADYRKYMALK
ncbi:MAG: tetratricopeptide repeat protein [bacterium]|nr:tetratricopeptide repeat protein [bacterium]